MRIERVYVVKVVTVFSLLNEDISVVRMLFLRGCISFDYGGGYSGVFRMCESEDTFCRWLKKNYQEFACCLTEKGYKPLKLTFFSGDTKNQGLWLVIQGAPASFCVAFSAN